MTTTVATTYDSTIAHADCLANAAIEIFGATCGVQLTPKPCDLRDDSDSVMVAVISLVGDVDWTIYLALPRQTAAAVAAKFAGFEIPFDSPDMGDAVGELSNILAGRVKALLAEKDLKANLSLPSVLRADSVHVLTQSQAQTIRMCFASPLGNLWTGIMAAKEA
jgi:CheY-specific phosphatase CheX